ncbi:recombinase family protein [Acetobacterium wieringae]|uniref:Recombinase family protein n=1 Tax=Acetobacterium wieringae TaxID=52694 RepID=A0ABY6HEG5_9FIRM|nr:recombinase family protein [Acetobacterium wieringae]UYO61864.1 recombinase family protein [Acetobacterium wieringae]
MSNKKAALYIRVSTAMQADRDSLPLQRSDLANYAKLVLNIDDYEIFEDAGFSAKNTDRPKYQEMMARVRNREFSHILVWKIDRISRNLIDFCEMYEEIKKYDTAFISKNEQFDTSSAMGEAMLKIILVFAELERKLTGERVLSVMIDRASKGMWNGGFAPYGYEFKEGDIFPSIHPDESVLVRYIFDLYEDIESSVAVARKLHESGHLTRNGNIWGCEAVYRILRNPFYIGTYRYNYRKGSDAPRKRKDSGEWIVVEDNHPGIIDKEQFDRVQAVMKANHKGGSQGHRQSIGNHIFSGIVFCGVCGGRYTPGKGPKRKDGLDLSRYSCVGYNSGKACNGSISDIILIPFVFGYLANYFKLVDRITSGTKNKTIEKALLKGDVFSFVTGINVDTIEDIRYHLINDPLAENNDAIEFENQQSKTAALAPLNSFDSEIKKYQTAISRLEDLYLFSSESMTQSDFIIKKSQLQDKIAALEKNREKASEESADNDSMDRDDFLAGTVIFKKLMEGLGASHSCEDIILKIGKDALKSVFPYLISKVYIRNSVPVKIVFKNGLIHNFTWEPGKRKVQSKIELFLKSYNDEINMAFQNKGTITHRDLREMGDLNKSQAAQIVRALVNRNVIEQAPEIGKGCYKLVSENIFDRHGHA